MFFKEVIRDIRLLHFRTSRLYLSILFLHYAKINGMRLFSLGKSPKVCAEEFSRYRFCAIIGMSGLVFHAVLQFLYEQKKLTISHIAHFLRFVKGAIYDLWSVA